MKTVLCQKGGTLPFNRSSIILKNNALFRQLFAQTPSLRFFLFGTHVHCSSNKLVYAIQHSLQSAFTKGISIRFLWIPGHADILGNSKADELARAGSSLATVTPLAATVEEATRVVTKGHRTLGIRRQYSAIAIRIRAIFTRASWAGTSRKIAPTTDGAAEKSLQ